MRVFVWMLNNEFDSKETLMDWPDSSNPSLMILTRPRL